MELEIKATGALVAQSAKGYNSAFARIGRSDLREVINGTAGIAWVPAISFTGHA
jgi:hypothetical protein